MGERDRNYQSGYDRDRARRDYGERYEPRRSRPYESAQSSESSGPAENDWRDDRSRYAGYYADRQYGTRGPDEREEGSRYGAEEEWRHRPQYEGNRRFGEDSDYRRTEPRYGRDWGGGGYGEYARRPSSSYTPGPTQSRPTNMGGSPFASQFTQSESSGQAWRSHPSQRDWRSNDNQDDYRHERGRSHESFGEQVREAGERIVRSVKRAFRGPKGYKRSDERIREDVSDRLGDHEYLDCSEVEVNVSNGEVTLTGTVNTRQEKFLAEEIADDVSGVNDVHNQLRVKREQTSLGTSESSSNVNATTGAEAARTRNARA